MQPWFFQSVHYRHQNLQHPHLSIDDTKEYPLSHAVVHQEYGILRLVLLGAQAGLTDLPIVPKHLQHVLNLFQQHSV